MEATVRRMAAATAFLDPAAGTPRGAAGRSPLDTPARAPFFTAAFTATNTADVKFALKCALAVEICFIAILGLDWPGLLTSAVTCVIVAQSTLGASASKALLRLAGAAVGGLLGLIIIAAVMPNTQGLASLLVPLAGCYWIAAWITAGSSRISYAGIQVGMALGICAVDVFGPTTDLVPPRDRVLGILLGIAVMGLVYGLIWPVRASRSMRPALAAALRAMGALADIPPAPADDAAAIARSARHRLNVYRALGTVLRLREESLLEPGAGAPAARAERDRILELTADAQGIFLAVLALARYRLGRTATGLPAGMVESLALPARPDLEERLAALGRTATPPGPSAHEPPAFHEGEIAVRREVAGEVGRFTAALAGHRQPLAS
jgi:multidrug resistance protein MdtO